MTDIIKQKALALVNEVADHDVEDIDTDAQFCDLYQALCRAIEQHDAFRQEVSDAVEKILNCTNVNKRYGACLALNRFIIAKPDPLVDALNDMKDGRAGPTTESYAACLRAAIEKRGGKIIFNEE